MSYLEGIALLLGLCGGMTLSGYWLASLLTEATPSERLAVSLLAGLGSLLLVVSLVNLLVPLTLPWTGLGLLPPACTLVWAHSRRSLWRDLTVFGRDRETLLVGILLALSFGALLWPMICDAKLLFYDGSPNHDSFFWVASAEYLKRHTYLQSEPLNSFQPLFNATDAIVGLKPAWGRMGTEGILALVSSLTGTATLKIYLYATASLFLPWVAAVFLTGKAFFNRKLTTSALVGLAIFQPIFIFFYCNANLPNLLGTIGGAAAVLATEHALRASRGPRQALVAWLVLLALSMHGLLCAYPEIIPFVGLPCGLLWIRHWLARRDKASFKHCLLVAAAAVAGVLINPVTTLRAAHGFIAVLGLARANETYASLVASLSPAEYLPALGTLSIPAANYLGNWLGVPLTLVLVACLFLAFRRAHDRFGALAIFSGGAFLLIYTVATDFTYGWQKTVQFTGVFIATAMPVGTLDALARERHLADFRRWLAWAGTVCIAAFMGFATFMSCRDVYKWSHYKLISEDWLALRNISRGPLRGEPVVVDAASFRMAFFHGMWAAYFLPESHLLFALRGEQNGGYLRETVAHEDASGNPPPRAVLVARGWADAFDVNSPVISRGREFAFLRQANRVTDLQGVYPTNGVPDVASDRFSLSVRPGTAARLFLEIAPRPKAARPPPADGSWLVTGQVGSTEYHRASISGPPPWRIEVPLAGRQLQTVSLAFSTPVGSPGEFPFTLSRIAITAAPPALSPLDGRIDFSAAGNWADYLVGGVSVTGQDEAVAHQAEATLQFLPTATTADVELELAAFPRFTGNQKKSLPVEFWFNDHLVFANPFLEPGVLRARILAQHWNEKPVATVRLRFPNSEGLDEAQVPALVLQSLTTHQAQSPRP